MSQEQISITNEELTYDFRLQDSWKTNNSIGQKQINSGIWVMISGNCEQELDLIGYDINGADAILFSNQNGLFYKYSNTDFNLDSSTDGADKILWQINNGIYSGISK